jgi:hypothetical protein
MPCISPEEAADPKKTFKNFRGNAELLLPIVL